MGVVSIAVAQLPPADRNGFDRKELLITAASPQVQLLQTQPGFTDRANTVDDEAGWVMVGDCMTPALMDLIEKAETDAVLHEEDIDTVAGRRALPHAHHACKEHGGAGFIIGANTDRRGTREAATSCTTTAPTRCSPSWRRKVLTDARKSTDVYKIETLGRRQSTPAARSTSSARSLRGDACGRDLRERQYDVSLVSRSACATLSRSREANAPPRTRRKTKAAPRAVEAAALSPQTLRCSPTLRIATLKKLGIQDMIKMGRVLATLGRDDLPTQWDAWQELGPEEADKARDAFDANLPISIAPTAKA